MNYLELHKEKLLGRYERVLNSRDTFLFQLRTFWIFLKDTTLFNSIIDEHLKKYEGSAKKKAMTFIAEQGVYLNKEDERFAVYCYLIEYVTNTANVDMIDVDNLIRVHGVNPATNLETASYFCEIFLNFFVDYLKDTINERETMLHSLLRYKRDSEWFESTALLKLSRSNSKKAEALLKKSFFKFLLAEGMDFYIEPSSVSGEVDCMIHNGKNRLVVESKVFTNTKGKDRKYILSGFHQAVTYANNYNESCGYLLIYKTGTTNIKFELKQTDDKIPYLYYNNKLFYFLVIDLNHDKSASKKGVLKAIEIKESELVEVMSA